MAVRAYEYETSPRKYRDPYIDTARTMKNKAKAKTKAKVKEVNKIKIYSYIALIFAMFAVISFRNSLINETYNQKESLKTQVSAAEKENEQLRINIENSLNLENIQRRATEELGMQKSSNSQKVYINLEKKDYIETGKDKITIEDRRPWIVQVVDNFLGQIK